MLANSRDRVAYLLRTFRKGIRDGWGELAVERGEVSVSYRYTYDGELFGFVWTPQKGIGRKEIPVPCVVIDRDGNRWENEFPNDE